MQLGNHTNHVHSRTEIIMKKQTKPMLAFYEVRNK